MSLVLEVYLAGASVNVILRVWASCSKSGITTTNKEQGKKPPNADMKQLTGGGGTHA
jgi:hypothetical protein